MAFNRKIKKVELSPKLKLGVGRGPSSVNILKISGTVFLLIALGLTINSLRYILSPARVVTTQNPSQPKVLGASDTAAGGSQNTNDNFIIYTVKSGDTVFSIAQKYNIAWTTIATLNNLTPPYTLKIGQELKIPKQ
jgi:LysM repeat protein